MGSFPSLIQPLLETTLIKNFQDALSIVVQMPGNFLILLPDYPRFTIAEVSKSYNLATLTDRNSILNKGIFEVFPDNPNEPMATGVNNLRASLMAVLKTGETHEMPLQKYDVKNANGDFVEKYWLPVNQPVFLDSELAYIIHRVEDVTETRRLQMDESYFRSLADETPFMVWRAKDGLCTYVNKAWTIFTGISFRDSLGIGYKRAFYSEDIEIENGNLLKLLMKRRHMNLSTGYLILTDFRDG